MNNRDRRYRRHMACLTRSCCLIYSLPVAAAVAFVDSFVGSSFVANVRCDVAEIGAFVAGPVGVDGSG